MVWIFAAVVLILMVAHPGFRKVAFWIGGGATALLIVGMVIATISNQPRTSVAATQAAPFDPDAYLAQSNTDSAECRKAKQSKDSRTAFFVCGATQADASDAVPDSAPR